ncbi:hypothetical protein [Bradyrhizobium sp. USDA 223]|uniref:hypothetical protein n=1 Tax=Bradyrhizobium sp. USDA 223 TaxID=3156306 RepID=UPI003838F66D
MTSDPEEQVRLQGYGEMTLRTAVETLMLLAPRERSDAAIFRVRDGVRLAQSEIAELASQWSIDPAPRVRSPKLVPEQHWWCATPRCRRCWWPSSLVCWWLADDDAPVTARYVNGFTAFRETRGNLFCSRNRDRSARNVSKQEGLVSR